MSASSSSSLSAQATPPRAFTSATLHQHQRHTSSHAITVSQSTASHMPLINSHPFTQHRIDVTPALSQAQVLSHQQLRTLTTSSSTSCLHQASYMAESSDEEMIPHSRSYQHLQSAAWQQQQESSLSGQVSRLTATHSYSSSSIGLAITRPTSAASVSSSPDSAPPTATYPSSSLYHDSRPVVTHNAVLTIRPNVSSISLNTARTFRTHRRPIALDSPTPSPVQHSDVEDDSPPATSSRSLFRPTTSGSGGGGVVCYSGIVLSQQPLSPGSHPGTCMSILRSQRMAAVC